MDLKALRIEVPAVVSRVVERRFARRVAVNVQANIVKPFKRIDIQVTHTHLTCPIPYERAKRISAWSDFTDSRSHLALGIR
jgi:hypothetical protein